MTSNRVRVRHVVIRALAWLIAWGGVIAIAREGWETAAIIAAIAVFAAMLFWPKRLGGAEACPARGSDDARRDPQ